LKGARICSIVGATFCLGLEEFEIFLMDGLKGVVREGWRIDFVHEEHIQAAS
jgi:hypothetical protein